MKIVVTGASRGIGYQVAKKFALQDGNQVLALSNDRAGLKALEGEVKGRDSLRIHEFDVVRYESEDLLQLVNALDGVDLLINNAGAVVNKSFTETSMQEWQGLFDVNLFAPVRIIRDLLSLLQRSDRAHIVNIGSIGGFQGSVKFAGLAAYSSSKAALASLTESLAVELKAVGISVNCLCLGSVNTEMFREAFPGLVAGVESDRMADFICDFAVQAPGVINGKVLPISVSTP